MPYKNEQDRCDSHISLLRWDLARARRAVRRIPRLEREIAKWVARKNRRPPLKAL